MKNNRAEKAISFILGISGLFFFCAAVLVWFTGSHRWEPLGIKVSLDDWWKPWWIGTVLLVVRGLFAAEPGRADSLIFHYLKKLCTRTGIDADRPGICWSAWGMLIGAVAGFFYAVHYYYLASDLALRILAVILAGIASAVAHILFFVFTEYLFSRITTSKWRVSCVRMSLYLVIWSVLVTGPLRSWEARGTEPIFLQGSVALLCGALMVWLMLAKWRLSGLAGRVRRWVLGVVILFLVAASLLTWRNDRKKSAPSSESRHRVILITVDTTRADYLSCYGYPRSTSPSLDKLAGSGARFTRAFCPMGITDPSHASILTGTYPRTHGLVGFHQGITGPAASMADAFRDRGFVTMAVTSRERLLPSDMNIPGFMYETGPAGWMVQTGAADAFRRAVNLLHKHRDRDVFLWVHFFDPHHPYEPHPKIAGHFLEKNLGPKGGDNFLKPDESYTEEKIKYRRDLYAGEVYYMDHWIGRLVEYVNFWQQYSEKPPFIIVIGDHGEALAEYQERPIHYGFGHGGIIYNGVAHVPLIMSWPGAIPEGVVIDSVAETVDVAPTVLDYMFGAKAPLAQGRSLLKIIEGSESGDGLAVIQRLSVLDDPYRPYLALPQYALVKDNFKIMITEGDGVELYDLAHDWNEGRDIAPDRPDRVRELTAVWEQWMDETPETRPARRDLSPRELKALRDLGYIQ